MTFRPNAAVALSARSPRPGPTWTDQDGELLRSLREAAGLDEAVWAKRNAISVDQLRTLEGRGSAPFYSEAIKARLGQRLLASLGHSAPAASTPQADPSPSASPSAPTFPPPSAAPEPPVVPPAQAIGEPRVPRPYWPALSLLVALAVAGPLGVWLGSTPGPITPRAPPPAPAAPAEPPLGRATEDRTSQAAAKAEDPTSRAPAAPACSAAVEEPAPIFTPDQAQKPANYVYVVATAAVRICLVDAGRQVTQAELRAGGSRNIQGRPPFRVIASDPQALQMYFQGQRVPAAAFGPGGVVLQAL